MNEILTTQKIFFEQIRSKIAPNLSYVHEISEILGISYDSAYRRIRGEKELTFDEIGILSKEYDISLDSIFNISREMVNFHNYPIENNKLHIADWLKVILQDLKRIQVAHRKEVIYGAKDPPIFHYFQFPEIGAFKMFFWEKTLFQFPELEEKQFAIEEYDPEVKALGEQILATANTIPTIEIWNLDDLEALFDCLVKWIRHIQKQAELGFKFSYGSNPEGIPDSYKFYENEVVLNDNIIYVGIDDFQYVYMTYNVASLLKTSDEKFCRSVHDFFYGLMRKSTFISSVGDKERNRFFNCLMKNIDSFHERVKI